MFTRSGDLLLQTQCLFPEHLRVDPASGLADYTCSIIGNKNKPRAHLILDWISILQRASPLPELIAEPDYYTCTITYADRHAGISGENTI